MYKTFSTIFILNLLIGEIFKPVRYIYSSSKNNYYLVSKSTVASYCHNLRKFVFDICDILEWLCLRTEFAVPLCPLLFVTMRDQAILVYVLWDFFFVFYSSWDSYNEHDDCNPIHFYCKFINPTIKRNI